jgi:hypothetical protein
VSEGEVLIGKYFHARAVGSDSFSRYPADPIKPGEWNRAVLQVGDGRNTLSLNGKKVASRRGDPPPAGPVTIRGAVGLELRNIFIRGIKP